MIDNEPDWADKHPLGYRPNRKQNIRWGGCWGVGGIEPLDHPNFFSSKAGGGSLWLVKLSANFQLWAIN